MHRYTRLLTLIVLMAAALPLVAAPRIGLVLSGGGARGAAHIGVLRVLEEMRIPIHALVGTSMGSLVGGGYAGGLDVEEMARRVSALDWNELLNDDPPRPDWPIRRKENIDHPTWDFSIGRRDGEFRLPKGALAGQKVQLFFADLAQQAEGVSSFDQLPIPFRAVATNLENGRMKVFDSGSLPEAMRASMSVPGLFAPLERADGIYVDGGLVRNLPVDVVRAMGVDVVIAVNLGSSYLKREELGSVLGVAGQMIAILTEQNVERSVKELDPERDLLIVPQLGDIGSGDFPRAAEAIAIGEQAARAVASELARFSVSEAEYTAWRRACMARVPAPTGKVQEVRVSGLEYVNPDLFDGLKAGQVEHGFDRRRLEEDLESLYAGGDFERISYRVERDAAGNHLIVDAIDKAWGPGYLSFGLGFSSDNQGDNRFGLRGTYRQTWMDRLGAEWLTTLTVGNAPNLYSEFYQPFSLERTGFVAPYVELGTEPLSAYVDGNRVARYDISRNRLGVDLGTAFGTDAELRGGLYYGATGFELDTGDASLPEGTNTDAGARARFVYDTLDSGYAPRHGFRLVADYRHPLEALGGERLYRRLSLQAQAARSWGDDTLVGMLQAGTGFGDDMPYYEQFTLGGFLKLSGYANEQFRGNQLAQASLVYYRRLTSLTPPLGRGIYVGGSLEYGRLWDVARLRDGSLTSPEKDRFGGSVFVAADSWLGPLYLGWGLAAEGDHTLYFQIGRP